MKLYLKIGTVLVIALIAWLLLHDKAETTTQVNKVSLQIKPVVTPDKPKPSKQNKVKKPQPLTNSEISKEEKALLAKELKQLSYIQLYDMSEDLFDCIDYLIRLDSQREGGDDGTKQNVPIDFMQEYYQNIPRFSHLRQQQATETQLGFYREHIENCKSTVAKVKSLYNKEELKTDNIYYIDTKLKSLMQETQAKSDEEKILKSILEDKVDLRKALEELFELKEGKPMVTEEEIRDLIIEIDELKWKIIQVKQIPEENREKNLAEMEAKLKNQKDYLASLYEFDKSAYEIKSGEFFLLIDRIKSKINSKYPRVFKEVFEGLNFKSSQINLLPARYILNRRKQAGMQIPIISETIFESVPIENKRYFNQLLQPALDLYLCYLGDECRLPKNRRLAQFCFMPEMYINYEGVYFEACDMDLETFYFDHYLTENQVEDLSLIFDYLVENYAK